MEKGQNGNEFESDGVPWAYWYQEWKILVLRLPGLTCDLDTGIRVHSVLERVQDFHRPHTWGLGWATNIWIAGIVSGSRNHQRPSMSDSESQWGAILHSQFFVTPAKLLLLVVAGSWQQQNSLLPKSSWVKLPSHLIVLQILGSL